MTIGIDITSLIYQRGVSRYTSNLVRALGQLRGAQLALYGYSFKQYKQLTAQARLLQTPQSSLTIKPIPQSLMSMLWQVGLMGVTRDMPTIDVFHSWDWLQPPDKHIPVVSTIHDLAMLKHPETAHPEILRMHQRSWQSLKNRQAHLLAVSQATKKDIVELLGYPNYLVHVVHEGLPLEVRQVSESLSEQQYDELVRKLALHKPYVFFVGTREPRKNLDRLIQAWQPLSKDFELIIAGDAGWDHSSQDAQAYAGLPLRFLGKVSDQELSVLYSEAAVFAYPSLDEGFGLPILEAFHHGTPVVTAQSGGTLEVAGNAAQLVDPLSVEDIRRGLEQVLQENTEAQRKRLQRMIVRLHMFSWEKVARETYAVYQQAIEDFHAK